MTCEGVQSARNWMVLLLFMALYAAGCGDAGPNDEVVDNSPVQAAERVPTAVSSFSGCALDEDCATGRHCFQGQCARECEGDAACSNDATCTERGRCVPTTGSPQEPDARTDLSVTNLPETVFQIADGQSEVVFSLTLDQNAPESGLPYRLERSDAPEATMRVERTDGGARSVNFVIPVGDADPASEDGELVHVKLFTPVGNYELALVPQFPLAGSYAGEATMSAFGTTGLPIEFQVVTDPNGAALSDADRAWLVLPVGSETLFSPLGATDEPVDYVARELNYDDFVDRWVASFEMAFDLSATTVVSAANDTQVRRSMRFEIEPFESDAIIGSFTDRWSGLYEVRSANGVTRLEDVIYTGDLFLERFGSAPRFEEVEVREHSPANPQLLPEPPLSACSDDANFSVAVTQVDEVDYNCDSITSRQEFADATPDAQALCAVAVSAHALSGETTGSQIRAFLDDTLPNPGGQSFADFMEDCAAGTDGTCRPSSQVLCARQLVARAYRDQGQTSPHMAELVTQYQDVTREAYLGQQLGAFGTDSQMRLEWLETTDYPAVITSAVRGLNEQLLNDWKEKVLEVHLGVLQGQFDASGLAVLSRQVDGEPAADAREQVLTEMTQGWRGAMDALTLATSRWHTLFQGDAERAAKRDYVSSRMFDLYLSAGILRNLNLAAGAGYLSARLAGGFSNLLRQLGMLSLPFDELVYARDAEVVINTSVDPNSDNDTLLGERQADAIGEIERAEASVLGVLERARAEALNEEQLRNRMNNEINDLRDSLVQMCGMPAGCTSETFRTDPECQVRVEAGECGFTVDKSTGEVTSFGPGQQSVSEAGRALLEVASAAHNIGIADEEVHALAQRAKLEHEELQTFATTIEDWNQRRLEGVEQLEANVAERANIRSEAVRDIFATFEQRAELRKAAIQDADETFREWDQIRVGSARTQIGLLTSANASRALADGLRSTAESVKDYAAAAVSGFPTAVGTSNDPSGAGRLAVRMGAAGAVLGMRSVATAADVTGAGLEIAKESHALMQGAEMAALEDEDELEDMVTQDEIDTLKAEQQKIQAESSAQLQQLQDVIEVAQAYLEARLAYERDLDEFRQRRLELRQRVTSIAGLDLRVQQAKMQYDQRVASYLGVVQRASLANSKLEDLELQRSNINSLVGSPGVIFGRANRLEQAELRLERAKSKLMDWLVALEYYAVRPFMDQRQQILLARNTYQLEKIAEELNRLERNCGGATNINTSTLSLKRDLLGLTSPMVDPVTEQELSPEQRFREILSRGYVPVDKRVRYSTDDTVGSLMSRDPDIMSATFFIDLGEFANLELTCNAKVASVDIKLVGDIGESRPTVTVLYDGTSKLRSCQPGIDDYVAMFGPDTTNYGKITYLRTAGRSMSPVAGINTFPATGGQANETLAGLPLASQYTVLINTAAGENGDVDWSQLEDIELELEYSYQDVFPVDQCD
ncbi:MAG: hypothetical protein ACQEVA_07365 [Myxococcota bacterium]